MILRNSIVTAGDKHIKISKSSDIAVGMYVYGPGIPMCSKISSVDEAHGQVVISDTPTSGDGVTPVLLQYTSASPGLYTERCEALRDIKDIIDERGDFVKITLRKEADVERDSYKSVEKRNRNVEFFIKAYPIDITPSEKQLEKAGIREKTDVVVWTSMLDWMGRGLTIEDVEFATRSTVSWQGNVYEIKDKAQVTQVSDAFLYITLGLTKR